MTDDDGAATRELVAQALERYRASTTSTGRMQSETSAPPPSTAATATATPAAAAAKGNAEDAVYYPLILQIETIIQGMPASETGAYYEAKRIIPHLVTTESDPVKYLRCFDMNPEVAAASIVRYWNTRRDAFGERWFRPMISTSDGALNEGDRDFLRTGHLVFLPNDSAGRTVISCDTSRRLEHSPDARKRIFFYTSQVASENELSQTEGFVALAIFVANQKFDQYSMSAFLFLDTFPVKLHASHLVDLAPSYNSVPRFEQTFAAVLHEFATPIHRYPRKPDYVAALQAFGLSREGLPRCVGGLWSYKQHVQWQNDRTRLERQRHPVPARRLDEESGKLVYIDSNDEESDDEDEEKPSNMLQDHRRLLQEAMNQIPDTEKAAYIEAMLSVSSEIKENEANIDWFLLVEELNCWLAAKRLAQYWNLRAETFREQRYAPMNQTGEGALKKVDVHNTLHSSFILLLPSDKDGRPVIWIDASRLQQQEADVLSVQRCMFYMFSILAENEESQKDGAVLLWMLLHPFSTSPFQGINLNFLQHLVECLPINFKAVHLLSLLENGPPQEDLSSHIRFGDDVYHHVESTSAGLVAKLKQYGINQTHLPKQLGGEWGTSRFYEWSEIRTRFEWKLPLGLSGRSSEVAEAFRFPSLTPYSALTEEEKAVRKRRMNVIHSRRKRDRIKVEEEVLTEHIEEMRQQQGKLVEENRRLESLQQSAMILLKTNAAPYFGL